MSNPGGSVRPGETKTGPSSFKPPVGDGGPIIEESQESEEYQQDLKVVVGTTIGVIAFVGLVVVAVLLYRVYRARQRALAYTHHNDDSLDRNVSVDIGGEKCQPVVFLLYANDCPIHQRVVEALAGFLMEVCGVTITLDILEEADIIDRGIDDWLVDRLQEADYIMVMCSLGARLRCSKKHIRFKPIGQHLLPDYFSIAVDYVAEKMRVEKQKGLDADKFLVGYMDYSTQSDIPPQLETASRFCLMKDIHKLHTHLRTQGPDCGKSDSGSQHSGRSGDCETHYHETETGSLLKATIEQAKVYFKDNPSWMDDRLEPSSSSSIPHWVGMGKSSRKRQHNSVEEPLLLLTNSLPPSNSKPAQEFVLNNLHSSSNPRWSGARLSTDGVDHVSSSMVDINNRHHHHVDQDHHHHHSLHRHHHNQHNHLHRQMYSENGLSLSKSGGIFQRRQNSLPSSLASSGLILPPSSSKKDHQHLFRSMDNFCDDSLGDGRRPVDHDGVPCLFCGDCHMEGIPECKLRARDTAPSSLPTKYLKHNDDNDNHNYQHDYDNDSMYNLHTPSLNNISHSQTILQAEVHQEWGTPVRSRPTKDVTVHVNNSSRANTFGGGHHLQNWEESGDRNAMLMSSPHMNQYQSLPPNHPPPPSSTYSRLSNWDGLIYNNGKTLKWDQRLLPVSPDIQRERSEKVVDGGGHLFDQGRTLSQSSMFTNGSDSVTSDTDSLKRDLQSIQNISSFQDFVNSSQFVTQSRNSNHRVPDVHLLPSLSSSPHLLNSFQSFIPPMENGRHGAEVGTEIEMRQVGVEFQEV